LLFGATLGFSDAAPRLTDQGDSSHANLAYGRYFLSRLLEMV
jgi:hypothetical protein